MPLRVSSQQNDNVSWGTVRAGSFRMENLHSSNDFTDRGTFVLPVPPRVSLVTSPVAKTKFTMRNSGHHRHTAYFMEHCPKPTVYLANFSHLPNPEAPPLGVCSLRPKEGTEKVTGEVLLSDSEWRGCRLKFTGRTSISGVRVEQAGGGRCASPGLLWLFIWFLQHKEDATLINLSANI